jgi:hypothetical protein
MAQTVPDRSGRQTGGTKVILICLDICAALGSAVLKNSIPAVKKGPSKSPVIATFKKSRFDFETAVSRLFLSGSWDRSTQEKIFPNIDGQRWRNKIEIEAEIGTSLTTSHLFRPGQRRKATSSLRNWQPKSALSLPTMATRRARRGGGGSTRRSRSNRCIDHVAQKIYCKGAAPQAP